MKNIIVIIFSLFSFVALAQGGVEGKKDNVAMFFEKGRHHDFGDVVVSKPIVYVFKFTNNGNVPIIVSSASSSCSCAVPEAPKEPILPGKTGEVKVTFTDNNLNRFQKSIVLITNLPNPRVSLYISGNVVTQEKYNEKHKK